MQVDDGHFTPVDVVSSLTDDLPTRLRLLCVGPEEPSWVSLTLQLDAEGCLEPRFRWVSSSSQVLAILRDESFDCVLVSEGAREDVASPWDPLSLLQVIRASGYDDPLILITTSLNDERWIKVCRQECEVLLSSNLWESPALVPMIKRAMVRVELSRENHRLAIANHRRLVRDRDEAEHLLKQQRLIIAELESLAESPLDEAEQRAAVQSSPATEPLDVGEPSFPLPEQFDSYYHELLRTYVIMGSGSLGTEISKLAELLSLAGLSPRDALQLHLERVESLIRGLGNRSARHVMARADLLALELMVHLGECYRKESRTSPYAHPDCREKAA